MQVVRAAFTLALGVVLACAPGGRARADQPQAQPTDPPPIVQAHRGGVPANSLAGLRESIRLGVGELEIDVRRTADGVLVLHHDAVTGSECSTKGLAIATVTWSVLQNVRCSGEPLPSFDAALQVVGAATQSLMVDVKRASGESDAHLASTTREIVRAIAKRDLVGRTRLSTSEWTVVAPAAHAELKSVRVAAGELAPSLKRVKAAAALGIDEYSIKASAADLYLARFPARYGMGVTLWGTDSDDRLRYAVDVGSRYLTTDDAAGVLAMLRSATPTELLKNRRIVTTRRSATSILSATLKPNQRRYPVVIGTALPVSARERLVDVQLRVSISGGDKSGQLRIGGPNMPSGDDVVIAMPRGSKSYTVRQSVGDNRELRVYTTRETAKVTIKVLGWRTLDY